MLLAVSLRVRTDSHRLFQMSLRLFWPSGLSVCQYQLFSPKRAMSLMIGGLRRGPTTMNSSHKAADTMRHIQIVGEIDIHR